MKYEVIIVERWRTVTRYEIEADSTVVARELADAQHELSDLDMRQLLYSGQDFEVNLIHG